jgi:hypothetical protein
MDDTLFYLPASGKTYWSSELQQNTGFSPSTDPGVLAANGIYTVNQTQPPADIQLYTSLPTYTIVGNYADQTWVPTARPLPTAKENGSNEVKTSANSQEAAIVSNQNLSTDLLTAVSSQDPIDRPARFQTVLDAMATVSDQLDSNLTAIDAATTVDEIQCIVHGASGIMVTGRGGAGPNDMQPSYFTDLQGLPPGVGEPELEIYIPGTDTVISYDAGLPDPYKFDSAGECYNTGDYRTVIRVAATSQVLSTVYPAEGPAVPVAWTYNPTIPSLGGSSSSQR